MSADNVVLLFTLLWTFMAVCQADKNINLSCENVTGSVGKEVNLTCSVSLLKADCCIEMYKFQYPERFNDPAICKKVPPESCEQRNSFTCRYTPTTAMTEQFRFFVQTTCGAERTEFTMDISESSKNQEKSGSMDAVITPVVGLSVIIIFIIILMTIICKKKSFGFQKRMFPCIKHDDDNSNYPEDVI
ncbi:uncharacterized protein LOC131550541 isoform X2 [Onychostoma macrolepis]|uniref:uncharacterized protein LOC131550541 isoform X2 n=1 Tax=Onychostoma macrolepis TaxID=369639 RepID=UPI00272D7855|nr:uncharacterized protein LOC131550541 isoform X2 [Onychostoma macrolepis]